MTIYYQKNRSKKIAMKGKSCLQKLQDSSSKQLAALNKVLNSSNKIDFEKDEPSKQKLRKKKVALSYSEDNLIRKGMIFN